MTDKLNTPAYKSYDQDSLDLDPGSPFYFDHVSRYWWAGKQVLGKSVLDCACGKGYGSFILSQFAKQVVGIDLNSKSLELSRTNFSAPNLSFQNCDVFETHSLGVRFDFITAFEVIEHIPPSQTDKFLAALVASLNPGGTLLLSTPNHEVVLKSGSFVPDFHINNFKSAELKAALKRHFDSVQMLGQFRPRNRLSQLIFDLDFLNLRHPIGRPLRQLLGRPNLPSGDGQSVKQSPMLRELFEAPSAEMQEYRFSPRHWRQAGLTVSVCSQAKNA